MKNTLVTGATGFLGTHLLKRLREEGASVRVLSRSDEVEGVETVRGSVEDEAAVERALENVDRVYHLAGKVSRNPDDAREMYRLHVEATALLCKLSKAKGVERIVLASTSGTIAVSDSPDSVADETARPPLEWIGKWPYYTSKLYQEQTALRECEGGPELVILNPSLLLGPGDKRLSSTEDVLKFVAGDIPVVPPGGINFVDVRDVAAAFVAAMSRGRASERYLLGGPNWSFERFFEKLERISHVKGPRLRLPEPLYAFVGKAADALFRQLDRAPPVDRISVEMGERFWYLDCSKAERELDFRARDPYETLFDTVSFIKNELLGENILSSRDGARR
ncbi:MAG TPA: NAD-dependent epimerase/dehydratase family protein [Vicinamibacteria bacterium]|nr:NAD-dependent epimerase/dehydratase family protein [Vicinamibacteria bacterium]